MIKKIGLIVSISAILLGLAGLVALNTMNNKDESPAQKSQDDVNRELYFSDLEALKNPENHEFYGSLFRLSQKRDQKAFAWIIDKGLKLEGQPFAHVLEHLGYFYDEKQAREEFDKLWASKISNDARIGLAKSLGKIVSSWTGARIEKIYPEVEKQNNEALLVHLNSALHTSAMSGEKKALALQRLLYLSAGKEQALALTYLGRIIPNHPDVLASMERSIYQVKDGDYLDRAILHLAKYHPKWIVTQGEKIRYLKNEVVARSYVRTLFISCPENLFGELQEMLIAFPSLKTEVMTTLLSLPRKEAFEFFTKNEAAFNGLKDLHVAKSLLQKGEVSSSCIHLNKEQEAN